MKVQVKLEGTVDIDVCVGEKPPSKKDIEDMLLDELGLLLNNVKMKKLKRSYIYNLLNTVDIKDIKEIK